MRKTIQSSVFLALLFTGSLSAQDLPQFRAFGASGISRNPKGPATFHMGGASPMPLLLLATLATQSVDDIEGFQYINSEVGYARIRGENRIIFSPIQISIKLPPFHHEVWQPFATFGPSWVGGHVNLSMGGGLNYWIRDKDRGITFEFRDYRFGSEDFSEFRVGVAFR